MVGCDVDTTAGNALDDTTVQEVLEGRGRRNSVGSNAILDL